MKTRPALALTVALGVAAAIALAGPAMKPKRTPVAGVQWYASMKDAMAEAKRDGKPILLLSMFGKLDEPMPCANARTLRATLFQDPEFRKIASEDVIPAWEMVRAVPKVEIDLGEGKKIVRTVRGNAVMYLCTPDGRVLDAFPGVYTAKDFIPMLRESLALADQPADQVIAFHRERGEIPRLTAATMGKAMLESPTLDLIGAQPTNGAIDPRVTSTNPDETKFLVAARRISDMSLRPMPPATVVRTITGREGIGEDPKKLAAEIMARDSQNNMNRVRPVVHLYLASRRTLPTTLEARDAILGTILKIPYKDPYFGLKDVLLPGTPD